jgi:asparagine synthase (glutamine-hydrolysing)
LSETEQSAIARSGGAFLTERYWGCYVALLGGPAQLDIVRAPFGDLPCYWWDTRDLAAASSDVSLLKLSGLSPQVDWGALARRIAHFDHLGSETCLSGVQELRGGDKLTLTTTGTPTRQSLWSPWTFAAPEREIADRADAISRIRYAARLVVAARTAGHKRLLLLLSGGWDSSLVATCLAHADRSFSCLTLFTDDASGDESRYASEVAAHLNAPFDKVRREIDMIDIRRSESAHLPRPTRRCFEQESKRLADQAARAFGATAIVDGGGGDNVFNNHLSVAPVADRWLREGPSAGFRSTVSAVAGLAQTSNFTVARRGIMRAWRAPEPASPHDLRYLSALARSMTKGIEKHPWLRVPKTMLPGKASYIAGLIPAQGLSESLDPHDVLPSLSLLVAQPLIETCLQIPSWDWFEPGKNRALARHAFAAELPTTVVARSTKGNPGGFIARIFEAQCQQIATFLRTGQLTAHGLLDWDELDRTFASSRFVRTFDYLRVMQLVDAEAWVQHWS